MSTHYKGLQRDHFENIKNRTKTMEGRLNKDSIRSIQNGDLIIFTCDDEQLTVKVLNLHLYSTFFEMVECHQHELIPNIESFDEALKVYTNIYPDKNKERLFGVVAIEFELL